MPPRDDLAPSTLGFKYPSNRDIISKNGDLWLEDKRKDDGAEGYWRIHDDLYDVTDYINRHPGGKMWLELTKGTDITEAFEVHHLSKLPEQLLRKFHIRKAKSPRHAPYTFNDDGFYRTLKRNVCSILETIPKDAVVKSNLLADLMITSTFLFAISSCYFSSYLFALFAGITLCWTTIIGHNYFHQKDNFRMYYFDLSLLESREWRISHVLSHHLLTNSIYDLEISLFEPILEYLPTPKTTIKKYSSWILAPILWLSLFHSALIKRMVPLIATKDVGLIKPAHFIPFMLPLMMYSFGGQGILATFGMWNLIILVGSAMFGMIGLNAAHHHPNIFHDGDAVGKEMDWGVHQLNSVMDRHDITGNHFLVMTNFGDHALHHFFPTLDHGLLQHIYPIFNKTCKQFNIDLRMTSQVEMIKGQFKQLLRTKPNPQITDLLKYSKNK